MAETTYQRGYEHMVHVSWLYGGGVDGTEWPATADGLWRDNVVWPGSVALMYVGFTGLPDYLKPSVPEILAVVVPLKLFDGYLVGDQDAIVVRSVTCAARGDFGHAANRDLTLYVRQFHHGKEKSFMHSAYCAAAQYLAALSGSANYIATTANSGLPTPTLCNLIARGQPNPSGIFPTPDVVPVCDVDSNDERLLREQYPDGNVQDSLVLDAASMGSGVDILSGKMVTVPHTSPWRVVPGHVRSVFTSYGEDAAVKTGRATAHVNYSVR
jgi:hypothetical protein